MASDNKVIALKRLFAAIKNDGTTPEQIKGDTVIKVLDQMTEFYGGSIDDPTEELGTLTLNSIPGTASGTTKITVSGNKTNNFKYSTGSSVKLPAYHDDLSTWTTWDGTSDITISDGTRICIAEVDSSNLAVSAGTVVANSNVE